MKAGDPGSVPIDSDPNRAQQPGTAQAAEIDVLEHDGVTFRAHLRRVGGQIAAVPVLGVQVVHDAGCRGHAR